MYNTSMHMTAGRLHLWAFGGQLDWRAEDNAGM